MQLPIRSASPSCRGGALLISLVAAMLIAGFVAAAYTLSYSQSREVAAVAQRKRALYLADAGISDAILRVSAAVTSGNNAPNAVGSQADPIEQRAGEFWCDIADNNNGTLTITSTGRCNLIRQTLEAVIEQVDDDVFDFAIFAGNRSGNPNYRLRLGGNGNQADDIQGNVYSGGGVLVKGDASVNGAVEASGTIVGAGGVEGVSHALPEIAKMNYAANHDYDVASLFATAAWQADDTGGSAWQLPETSPAHIFRKNPDDRLFETGGTAKDDYFLEDPYEPLNGFTAPNGKVGQQISLSGTGGKPGESGTDKVYFVDGNLWVHNNPLGRIQIQSPDPEGAKITFVVKGNVYFSDDVYIDDSSKSGVAFLAIADPAVENSGNIYLGDPIYGTLEFMQAYMYAENNFFDNNLSATGSAKITVNGNMTAGNLVGINRDYTSPNGDITHSKLTVNFDDRVSTGALVLPGLPDSPKGTAGYRVTSWREVSN